MKFILKLIIISMCFIRLNCYAEIFYGDYYLKEENISNYYEETDTLKREMNLFYNNYYEDYEEGYYSLTENPKYLNSIDENDYILKEVYFNKYEPGCEGPYTTFRLGDLSDFIRYIDFRYFGEDFGVIKEVRVFENDTELVTTMHNGNYSFGSNIYTTTRFVLDLGKNYDVRYLKIIISFLLEEPRNINFNLSFTKDLSIYIGGPITTLSGEIEPNHLIDFAEVEEDKFGELKPWFNYYSCYKTLYKHYAFKKIYLDVYTKTPLETYKHDENDYKEMYTYYEREKIELIDEITDFSEKVIISSTVPEEEIKLDYLESPVINEEKIKVTTSNDFSFIKKVKLNTKEKDFFQNNSNECICPEDKNKKYFKYLIIINLIIMLLIEFFSRKKKN